MSIAENIKKIRLEHGLSQAELGKIAGVSDKAVSTWELGLKTPRMGAVEKMANYFGITKSAIVDDAPAQKPANSGLPAGAVPFDPMQVAPLLGTVRAGLPMYAEENIEGYIPIRQTDGAKYFWLHVRGDSMNAAGMEEGDQILIREQPEVENGEIAVVLVNGDEATVKQFRREGDLVILTPRSLNPVYQPQIYDLKRVPVRVAGKVIECRKVY